MSSVVVLNKTYQCMFLFIYIFIYCAFVLPLTLFPTGAQVRKCTVYKGPHDDNDGGSYLDNR